MELPGLIRSLGPELPPDQVSHFAAEWTRDVAPKGRILAAQGEVTGTEVILLDGRAVSKISDSEGRDVCVAFHTGPGIVTPHVARTQDSVSLVTLEVTADARIATLDTDRLMERMLAEPPIRDWANAILRAELARKTDREWCLAALGGAARLEWFRNRYPGHEDLFAHGWIASFLGMTPVTLSRLRAAP